MGQAQMASQPLNGLVSTLAVSAALTPEGMAEPISRRWGFELGVDLAVTKPDNNAKSKLESALATVGAPRNYVPGILPLGGVRARLETPLGVAVGARMATVFGVSIDLGTGSPSLLYDSRAYGLDVGANLIENGLLRVGIAGQWDTIQGRLLGLRMSDGSSATSATDIRIYRGGVWLSGAAEWFIEPTIFAEGIMASGGAITTFAPTTGVASVPETSGSFDQKLGQLGIALSSSGDIGLNGGIYAAAATDGSVRAGVQFGVGWHGKTNLQKGKERAAEQEKADKDARIAELAAQAERDRIGRTLAAQVAERQRIEVAAAEAERARRAEAAAQAQLAAENAAREAVARQPMIDFGNQAFAQTCFLWGHFLLDRDRLKKGAAKYIAAELLGSGMDSGITATQEQLEQEVLGLMNKSFEENAKNPNWSIADGARTAAEAAYSRTHQHRPLAPPQRPPTSSQP